MDITMVCPDLAKIDLVACVADTVIGIEARFGSPALWGRLVLHPTTRRTKTEDRRCPPIRNCAALS